MRVRTVAEDGPPKARSALQRLVVVGIGGAGPFLLGASRRYLEDDAGVGCVPPWSFSLSTWLCVRGQGARGNRHDINHRLAARSVVVAPLDR